MESQKLAEQKELIAKSKQNDCEAQYELYQSYAKAMFNICYRITNHWHEAEDVLQEAFVKIFRNLHQYKGEASFGAWVKRVVVNQAISHVKKKKIEWTTLTNNHEFITENNGYENDQRGYKVENIQNALTELPEGYRIILSLYLLEGYDHQEIAEILDISVSTSKTQYMRGKQKLKKILQQQLAHTNDQ